MFSFFIPPFFFDITRGRGSPGNIFFCRNRGLPMSEDHVFAFLDAFGSVLIGCTGDANGPLYPDGGGDGAGERPGLPA